MLSNLQKILMRIHCSYKILPFITTATGTFGGAGEANKVEVRFGASWNENVNLECALNLLNLNGLCEVVHIMGLGMIQFVGGQYTNKQVKSFWSLLSLEDREDLDDIGQVPLEDGQDLNLHQYHKTARKQSSLFTVPYLQGSHTVS